MRAAPPADSRLLARYLRPEGRVLGALVGLLVVAMLVPLGGPILLGRFVDAALDAEPTSALIALAAGFLLVTLSGEALQLVVTWLSVRMAWRVGNNLRADLCLHALGLDLDWHAEHSPGQLIERIDGDIAAITKFSATAVLHLLGNAILMVGVLVVTAVIDWRASLVIAVTVVLAVAVMIRLRRLAVPFYDDEREILGSLYGDVEERLGGLEDLRANGGGRWAVHHLHQHSARWWRAARRASLRGDGAVGVAGAVFALGTIAMLALGVWQARNGALSTGMVFTLVRFSQLVSDPLWRIAEQLSEAQKAIAGSRRAVRLLSTEATIVDGPGAVLPDGPPEVELRGVTFGYGTTHPALAGLDLVIPAGSSLGVVGRTGSGKSTIGRLVARHWDTEQGQVLLGGVDVRRFDLGDLRRRVGVVTQEVDLFRASLRDNLTVLGAVTATDEQLVDALDQVGLAAWFSTLADGLDHHLDGRDELSAGEAQLLAFARVLLADPDVVILDEATSRLDPETEARLAIATERLLAGRTSLIIAHRLGTLAHVDQIAVLHHGRLVEHGPREALAIDSSTRYAALLAESRASEQVTGRTR